MTISTPFPWKVGDRVALKPFGEGVIVRVDANASHGLGAVTLSFVNGQEGTFAMVGLLLERPEEARARAAEYRARMANTRKAGAYKRGGRIIVFPVDTCEAGFGVDQLSFVVLDSTAPSSEIGNALLGALDRSKFDIPTPTSRLDLKPLVKAGGASSYATFRFGTLHCSILEKNGQIHIGASRNDGKPRGGWAYLPDRGLTISRQTPPDQIGATLLKVFELCE